jgi:hypothetical protein
MIIRDRIPAFKYINEKQLKDGKQRKTLSDCRLFNKDIEKRMVDLSSNNTEYKQLTLDNDRFEMALKDLFKTWGKAFDANVKCSTITKWRSQCGDQDVKKRANKKPSADGVIRKRQKKV